MLFSSVPFLFYFLPCVLLVYFAAPRKGRNAVLLAASLFFYGWGEPRYLLFMVFSIVQGYVFARLIERGRRKKLFLSLSVALSFALLGYCKYADFFIANFNAVTGLSLPLLKIALPIGISFYTFQIVSYVIDVYRGDVAAQRHFIDFAAYVAMFPQLIAGPIVRYRDIAPQLRARTTSLDGAAAGVSRFAVGLAKKVLIANVLAQLVSAYKAAAAPSVLYAWLYAIAFTLQIYFDFSAYSDMAIGMGRMIGLHYLENFDYPYISKSVTEFWRRWHMSLGTFFRDYVYIPLGGNRCSRARSILNMFIVWALTGLWHGASWNFVMWGLYFFVFLLLERLFLKKPLQKLRVLPHIYLCFVVYVGWILFHFTDIRLGWTVFTNLFGLNGNAFSSFVSKTVLENNLFLLIASCVFCTPLVKNLCLRAGERLSASETGAKVWDVLQNCVMPVAFLLLATCSLVGDSYNPFIYFQF